MERFRRNINYWLWKANLENIYHIEEIKTVPHCPWSHPFVRQLPPRVHRSNSFLKRSRSSSKDVRISRIFQFLSSSLQPRWKTPNETVENASLPPLVLETFAGSQFAADCIRPRLVPSLEFEERQDTLIFILPIHTYFIQKFNFDQKLGPENHFLADNSNN